MNTSLDCYNNDIESSVVIDTILDDSENNLDFFKEYFLQRGIGVETAGIIK